MKAIPTEYTAENAQQVLAALTAAPERLRNLRSGLSAAELAAPLGSGERSFTQALAHLVNCEDRSAEAIRLALLVNDPELAPIHPERQLGKLARHELLDFADLNEYFRIRRLVLLRVLRGLTAKEWSRTLREAGKQRRESVYWRARTLALHELEHLDELERKLGRRL
jgi:hypothetical protein